MIPPFFSNSGKWRVFFFSATKKKYLAFFLAGKPGKGCSHPSKRRNPENFRCFKKNNIVWRKNPGQKCPFLLILRKHPPNSLSLSSNVFWFFMSKTSLFKGTASIPLPMEEADLAFIFKKKTKPRSGRISKISIQSLASSFPFEDSGGLALPWNNYIILRLEKNQHLSNDIPNWTLLNREKKI